MTFRESLACSLQKRVGNLWKRDEFSDFTVVVENTSFKCHRFILSACSGFFHGLLNSQMKEQLESRATLVGMTANTFETVINTLYTGIDGLSNDNVLDVWSATELLEIDYLIEECQKFVKEKISVENCFRFLDHAALYAAHNVVDHSLDFISRHFAKVINGDSILHLSCDHFYKIVTHDYLPVDGEEVVLDVILKWVEYTPRCEEKTSEEIGNATEDVNDTDDEQRDHDSSANSLFNSGNLEDVCDDKTLQTNGITTAETNNFLQSMDIKQKAPAVVAVERNNIHLDVHNDESNLGNRKQHLLQLLSACRLFTLKPDYLDSVIQNHGRLFVDTGAHTLMQEALMYTLNASRRHEAWPEAAVHRASSFSKHVMVFVSNGKIMAYNLNTGRCAEFVKLPEIKFAKSSNFTITMFNNILFLLVNNVHGSQIKQFYMLSKERKFVLVNSIEKEHEIMLLPHGNYVYYSCLYNDDYDYEDVDCEVRRVSCVHGHDSMWSICGNLKHFGNCLVRFHKYVLVFLTPNEAITAQCYNTETKQTHNCEISMDGTSKDMTSFRHKEVVYLIQRNGSMWKVFSTEKNPVDFELVSKLWDFDCSLKGCVLYQEKLFIFCDNKPSTPTLTSLPGIFANLEIINIETKTPCLPMVLDGY
ncbi:hypothetical protein BsWGS_24339 [Bradybaena similaris]